MFEPYTQLIWHWADVIAFYSPLGLIGLWRWSVWLTKKIYARYYIPVAPGYEADVSVITPVYNENPKIFQAAIDSWKANGAKEIVAVIDHTDTTCVEIFKEFSKTFPEAKLIVTEKPGKRPALSDGIQAATYDIVALVDSDTIWGDEVRRQALAPFQDPAVGGVSTRQQVLNPQTLAQRMFNTQLTLRYNEELPFMTALGGDVITCLSGRTAFYRKKALLPVLPDMLHEMFWGKQVISGEDKRLTYLVERAGWKVAYQKDAVVYTPGTPDMKSFLKQRLRWTRNSWRADMRTLTQGWVWHHPRFVLYLIDRAFQPFTQLLSPIYFVVSMMLGLAVPLVILAVWWHVSRVIRLYPHLRRHPQDIELIPIYVMLNFYFALIKIYALLTMNRQGWMTRWDKNRLPGAPRWISMSLPYAATVCLIALMSWQVSAYQQGTLEKMQRREVGARFTAIKAGTVSIPASTESFRDDSVTHELVSHTVAAHESIQSIAATYNVDPNSILAYNAASLPNKNLLYAGMVLTIPLHPEQLDSVKEYRSDYKEKGPRQIEYDEGTNTIEIRGRGQEVTLSMLSRYLNEDSLQQLDNHEWLLSSNIVLKAGVRLRLSQEEVAWLKLKSTPDGFVSITAEQGQLIVENTKITSWDPATESPDTQLSDGRSFILIKGGSRLDAVRSEMSYLGFNKPSVEAPSSYGVTLSSAERLVTGTIQQSIFSHNYDGFHTSNATGVYLESNTMTDNDRYGVALASGTRSSFLQQNTVRNNVQGGIILSDASEQNHLRNNIITHNGSVGIQLANDSKHTVVISNTITDQPVGVSLQQSSHNLLSDNRLEDNEQGIRITQSSEYNNIEKNYLTNHEKYGIVVSDEARYNHISFNTISHNQAGMYIKASQNEVAHNLLERNETGIYFYTISEGNLLHGNTIQQNSDFGIYFKTEPNEKNYDGGNNSVVSNKTNISAI